MTVPEPTAGCEACPSGLEYATEDQLRGVIERHHALRTAKDAELSALRRRVERAEALNEYWVVIVMLGTGLTRERVEAAARRALKEADA